MDINGATALVTGANRGLGRAFAAHLLERGAAKVYAAARRPETVDLPGVEPIALDITDPEQVRRAADLAGDATLLVNNAGNNTFQNLVDGELDKIRLDLETHYFGTLRMVRAFAPVLGRNGGGAILNVLSASSWFAYDGINSYHAAKAAAWALTNGARMELAGQKTLVTALHLGMADTDMVAGIEGEKLPPAEVARLALDGVEAGRWEVLADDWSRGVKASLGAAPEDFYRF